MQGETATPGLVAHWVLPTRAASELKWLVCYVMLSRVPSLKQLRSVGLSTQVREIMEAGPPMGAVQTFATLFGDTITRTYEEAAAARRRLGW
jgi:hypothetical protein